MSHGMLYGAMLGVALGAGIGAFFDDIMMWLGVGVVLGPAIGLALRGNKN